jgi:hypothetical protein
MNHDPMCAVEAQGEIRAVEAQGEIPAQAERLGCALARLNDRLNELGQRISRVCRLSDPCPRDEKEKCSDNMSSLAQILMDKRHNVEDMIENVEDLLSRIEL